MLVPVQLGAAEPIIMMDDSLLVKKTGGHENEDEIATWTEYWLGETRVHRSAHVTLKKFITAEPIVGGF